MWLKDRAVTAGIRRSHRKPTKFQGYIQVTGQGRCIVPVGPWRASKGQALADAKTAQRVHQERRDPDPGA
jgi:hypothetical protein